MSASQLDLSKLALDRSASAEGKTPARRRWVSRYAIPLGILVGFIGLVVAAAEQLLSKPSVTVVPVIVKRGTAQPAGTPLFQAAGWVEPRPTSVNVASLTLGVVDQLLVVEGQQVTKGQPIARLIRVDAEIAVEQAQAALALHMGELQRAEAEQRAAITRLEQPVHLKGQLADAESLLAQAVTELKKLPFLVKAAEANVAFARSSLDGKLAAKAAIAGVIVEQAAKEHSAALAELDELRQREPHLQRQIDALQQKVDALERQLELLVEERRQVAEAEARVASANALRDQATLRLRQAELNLERTVVRAPMDGRILRLVASPGTRVMGLDEAAGPGSSTVVEMYDPHRLQVRADVRLEDLRLVTPAAPVKIDTASSGTSIRGRVLQTTSSANVQKNTLEVKVELIDPPATVSPEMLVTATFLAPDTGPKSPSTSDTERLYVPQNLIQDVAGSSVVWVVNANNQAITRSVTAGSAGPHGLVEILEGLNVTDKLIASGRDGLGPGQTVVISGEEPSLGVVER